MTLLDGLARHLADAGLGLVYRDTGAYTGDEIGLVIGTVPVAPPRLVALTAFAGPEADSLLPYDEPSVQLRVRGTDDERDSRDLAQAIYDELHGLGGVTLPDGTHVQLIVGRQAGPIPIGRDENGRFEHTVNIRAEVRRITEHRP